MSTIPSHERLSEGLRGLSCTKVELYAPESWSFDFESEAGLNVQCPWRIVTAKGIVLTGSDHRQKFGLPEPIDAQDRALRLLSQHRVTRVSIIEKTADLVIDFGSDVKLEVFSNSCGYEGWNCGLKSGLQVIGIGGGTTASLGS